MKTRLMIAALALAVAFGARLMADDAAKAEPKCPVSGKAINKEHSADFEGGKVYFCCPNCPGPFEKNTEKFAAKARHQMVLTGELEQIHCPISHKDFKADKSTDVSGVEVKFCCGNCKAKVEKMTADEQIASCFGKADCFKATK